jgi:hypothetical protein
MVAALKTRRSKEETAKLGEALYARLTQTVFGPLDHLKYAALAVDSGRYEIDVDSSAAIRRMKEREPDADIWLVRNGLPAAAYFRSPSCFTAKRMRPAKQF